MGGGKDYIAEATDLVLSGEKPRIESFLVPLLWMTAAGTLVAYLKSFSGNQYSAVVQRDARNAISKFRILLAFYQRSKGEYLLFGKGSEKWDSQALRDCFSYVSQNVFLLPQSLSEG